MITIATGDVVRIAASTALACIQVFQGALKVA